MYLDLLAYERTNENIGWVNLVQEETKKYIEGLQRFQFSFFSFLLTRK